MLADKAAERSVLFGAIGLFIGGIVFGPLALRQASKAESMNKSATGGKVLGWLAILSGIGQVVVLFVIIGGFLALSSSYGY